MYPVTSGVEVVMAVDRVMGVEEEAVVMGAEEEVTVMAMEEVVVSVEARKKI